MLTTSPIFGLGAKTLGLTVIAALLSASLSIGVQTSYAQFKPPPSQQQEQQQVNEKNVGLDKAVYG